MRAIAVLAVVLYHAGFHQLEGGYVGVDVFFVLSGFLIINIIRRDLSAGKFSFMDFYARRAKRLFPAAFALIVATVVFGAFFVEPQAYKQLSESAIASLAFGANIYFYFNTGYFDAATDTMPLIHMWSLGIEEQFYLITPVLLWGAFKLGGRKALIALLSVIGVLSFALTLYIVHIDAKFAFFQIPTRAWQFAIGGAIAFIPMLKNQGAGNIISLLGLAAVLYGIFTLSGDQLYPSYNALWPTLGSAALIYGTTTQKNLVKSLLSFSPMVWVGKVSYSTYLWHWPIIVYYRLYILGREFNPVEVVILTVASVFAGWLSWRFIEELYRHTKMKSARAVVAGIVGAAALALIPIAIIVSNGFPSRIETDTAALTDLDTMWEYECVDKHRMPDGGTYCVVGVPWDKAEKKALLWGDSHSEHLAPVLAAEARRQNMAIVVAPRSCPANYREGVIPPEMEPRDNFLRNCTRKQRSAIQWLNENEDADLVIMTGAWTGYTFFPLANGSANSDQVFDQPALIGKAMDTILEELVPYDLDIVIVGDVPRPHYSMNICFSTSNGWILRQDTCPYELKYLDASNVRQLQGPVNSALAESAARLDNVRYVSGFEGLCDARRCDTYVNGKFIYRDGNHIRRNLSEETLDLIGQRIGAESILKTAD